MRLRIKFPGILKRVAALGAPEPVFDVVCVRPDGSWFVLEKVAGKRAARAAAKRLERQCPGGTVTFVREGSTPALAFASGSEATKIL